MSYFEGWIGYAIKPDNKKYHYPQPYIFEDVLFRMTSKKTHITISQLSSVNPSQASNLLQDSPYVTNL
ncbi:MAG TPA: hypothetical protein VNX68_03000 [Nitrosopumilaceae archaeon]|nr:hypothetical protein [Nitrosopumilaceae archaeon]